MKLRNNRQNPQGRGGVTALLVAGMLAMGAVAEDNLPWVYDQSERAVPDPSTEVGSLDGAFDSFYTTAEASSGSGIDGCYMSFWISEPGQVSTRRPGMTIIFH